MPDTIGALVEKENRYLPGKWEIFSVERRREMDTVAARTEPQFTWEVKAECRLGHEQLVISGKGVNLNGALTDLRVKAAMWKEAFSG